MIVISHDPIDVALWHLKLNDPVCGGLVIFEGLVRNHQEGRKVLGLSYEAYVPMVDSVLSQIVFEAQSQFDARVIHVVHRLGDLTIGDTAVWIGVLAPHRGDAFRACEYVIGELKKRAPIWKKEHYVEGPSEWVACHCVESQ